MKKKKSFYSGAILLGLGAFISKALGALYRIPLTNILGGKGLGIYQMVFPVYALLLDFSGAGVPGAISRIIASLDGKDKEQVAYDYLRSSIRLLFFFGLICSVIMFVFSKPIATLQGESQAFLSYISLAPAVFLVSIISCYRGYFQGFMNMIPTATSQITEQVIKLILGLTFASLFVYDLKKAVAGATLAITISEVVALIVLYVIFYYRKKRLKLNLVYNLASFNQQAKTIIKTTIPITLIGVLLPFSQVIDSFLTVNILGAYRDDAIALYGLLGGAVMTVINLPVSICYGLATVAIPTVSASKSNEEENKNSVKVIACTIITALPCVIACFFGANIIVNILFRNLSQYEKDIVVKLLKIVSPCILTLSVLQSANAVLIGKGKLYTPVISLGIGVVIKAVLSVIFLKIPSLNIYGSGMALNACYFIVCLINLVLIFSKRVKDASKRTVNRQVAS